MKKIFKTHQTYKNKTHVIGKDILIDFDILKAKRFFNDESDNFFLKLKKLVK